jgi:transposase
MGIKIKLKWPHFGMGKLAIPYGIASLHARFHEPSKNWLYSKKKTYGYREQDEVKRQAFVTS